MTFFCREVSKYIMHVIVFVLLLAVAFRLLFRTPLVDKFLPIYGYLTMNQDRLYRLLSVIKETFAHYDIPWAITGTTLLSAVTLQNFMNKEKTIHIVVPAEHLPRITALTDQFYKQLGLGVQDLPDGGIRIGGAFALPFMDDSSVHIHGIQRIGDKWQTFSRKSAFLQEYYENDELFPTKMYILGNLDVPGPKDPIGYLQRNFGANANTAYAARAVRHLRLPVAKYKGHFVLLDDIPTLDSQVIPNAAPLIPSSRYGMLDLQRAYTYGTLRDRFPRGSNIMAPVVGSLY